MKIHMCIKGHDLNTPVDPESRSWKVNETKIFADAN